MDPRTDRPLVAVIRAIEDNRRALSELRSTVHNISLALEAAKSRANARQVRRPNLVDEGYTAPPERRGAHSIRSSTPRTPTFSEQGHGPTMSGWENVSPSENNTDRDYDYFAELDERLARMTPRRPGTEYDTRRPGSVSPLHRA
jgi:hypothetical protein